MKGKKGSISIEMIIIIILAVLVLVIVAAAFSGGMAQLWGRIVNISQTTSEVSRPVAEARCEALCGSPLYQTTSYFITDIGAKSCSEIKLCP